MKASEYRELMALGESGGKLDAKAFDELSAYAAKRKVRRPRPEWIASAKPTEATRYDNRGRDCSVEGCGKPAKVKGMCSAHYTRLVHRADPANRERAREASRRYAAKKRAEREAAKEEK